MLPMLINPLRWIFGALLTMSVPDSVTPFNRASNLDFFRSNTAESAGEDPASVPGIENPTMEDMERALGAQLLGTVDEEPAGQRRDAHGLGGCLVVIDAGTGEAEAGGGVASTSSSVTEVASSSVSSFARSGDDEEAGASDTEVLVDDGDPGIAGVSGAIEQTGIVIIISVAVIEIDSVSSTIFWSEIGIWGKGGGDGDGVHNWIAMEMILCDGQARGEMIIPGA